MDTIDYILSHKGRSTVYVDFWGVLAMGDDLESLRPTEGVVEAVKELDKKYRINITFFLRDEQEDLAALPKYPRWARKNIDEDALSGGWSFRENRIRLGGFTPRPDTVLITANMSHPGALTKYGRKIWLCLPEKPDACCPDEMRDKVTICRSWKEVTELLLSNEQV